MRKILIFFVFVSSFCSAQVRMAGAQAHSYQYLKWNAGNTTKESGVSASAIDHFLRWTISSGKSQYVDFVFWFACEVQANANSSIIGGKSATVVNSCPYTTLRGYKGNGTSQYLSLTGCNLSIQSKYTLNDAGMGIYCRTNQAVAESETGLSVGASNTQSAVTARYSDGNFYFGVNLSPGNAGAYASSDSRGLQSSLRTNSTTVKGAINGAIVSTAIRNSTGLGNGSPFVCCNNVNAVPSSFSSKEISFYWVGSSSMEGSDFYTEVQKCMTIIGANVP